MVSCHDPRFATTLIDAQMMQWLLDSGTGYVLQANGGSVAVFAGELRPESVGGLISVTRAFHDRVPPIVRQLYPPPPPPAVPPSGTGTV